MKLVGKRNGKWRHFIYLMLAAGMLLFASTQVESTRADAHALLFWIVWMLFAAVIVAGNVNRILMSAEDQRRSAAIKRAKYQHWENVVERHVQKRMRRKVSGS